jgi:hypothetical protein
MSYHTGMPSEYGQMYRNDGVVIWTDGKYDVRITRGDIDMSCQEYLFQHPEHIKIWD